MEDTYAGGREMQSFHDLFRHATFQAPCVHQLRSSLNSMDEGFYEDFIM